MAPLYLNGTNGVSGVDGSASTPALQGTDSNTGIAFGSDVIIGSTGGTERWRTDASGRLLVGTSSGPSAGGFAQHARLVSQGNNAETFAGAILVLQRGEAATAISSGEYLGNICFTDNAGNEFARIDAVADAAAGSGDYPGRLVFSVCRDGQASPTEAMRIGNSGNVTIDGVTNNSVNALVVNHGGSGGPGGVNFQATNGTYSGAIVEANLHRAATSGAVLFRGLSGNGSDAEFNLRGDGNAFADGTWSGGGADYAEYFEWSDANPNSEDRRGISVVLDGSKIREAVAGEDPIGVISGNPSVVGDAAWNKWNGKYLRDEFGSYIQEDYEVVNDEGETVIQQRRKLNPDYDPDQEYVSREQRPEWDCVGLMGKLRIRNGQVTGSRWIKMRDINDSVEEWLVR